MFHEATLDWFETKYDLPEKDATVIHYFPDGSADLDSDCAAWAFAAFQNASSMFRLRSDPLPCAVKFCKDQNVFSDM